MPESTSTNGVTDAPIELSTRRKKRPEPEEGGAAPRTSAAEPPTSPIRGAAEINEALSAELGETVLNMDPQWIKYANEGLVIDLHCHRERYRMSLSSDDLGIVGASGAETKEMRRILPPIPVYLLPKDAIAKGDTKDDQARGTLRTHAFKTFWGYWLHRSKYPEWRAAIDGVKAEYEAVVDEILAKYDDHRRDAIVGMVGLINRTYNNLRGTETSKLIPGFENEEQWKADRRKIMTARIPSPETIRKSYRIEWEVYRLPLLQEIERDRAVAGEIRLDEAERLMLADIEATAKRKIQGGVDQFMAEIQAQVQNSVCAAAEACLRALQKNQGKLGRNSVVQVQNLIEATRSMVFWQDETLENRMQALQRIIDTPAQKRDPKQLRETFVQLGATARLALFDLGAPVSRSAAALGIPDDLDELTEISRRVTSRSAVEIADDLGDLDDGPAVRTRTSRQAIEAGAL